MIRLDLADEASMRALGPTLSSARPHRRVGEQRRRRHPHRSPAPRCRTREARSAAGGRSARHRPRVVARGRDRSARRTGGGVIINMSWDHVLTGMAGRNPQMFSAVKGGVLAFSKSLARSVAPRVRVNVARAGLDRDRVRRGARRAHASRRSPAPRRCSGGARRTTSRARRSFWRRPRRRSSRGRRCWSAAEW